MVRMGVVGRCIHGKRSLRRWLGWTCGRELGSPRTDVHLRLQERIRGIRAPNDRHSPDLIGHGRKHYPLARPAAPRHSTHDGGVLVCTEAAHRKFSWFCLH